ncbi:sugar ABC transporter substrate-binding protein [Streptomyces puniciscabiei]
MERPRHQLSLLAVTAASVLVLAACGGASAPSATASAKGADSAAVTAAKAELAQYTQMPEFAAPNKPFDVSRLKGRTIAVVVFSQSVPALANTATGIKQAADAAGVRTSFFDAKATPSLMNAGVRQAVAQRADAIILGGVPSSLVPAPLKAAAAAGIPVVSLASDQPDPGKPGQGAGAGVYANAGQDMRLQGRLAADEAIVDTGGRARVILMTSPGINLNAPIVYGVERALKTCSGCAILKTTSTQVQDWATGLDSQTASALNEHRDANVILPVLATMALFAVPAVQKANAVGRVGVYSTSGSPASAKAVGNSGIFAGLAGQSDFHLGWLAVNQALRGMLGLKPGNPVVPSRMLTPALVKKTGSGEQALYGTAYEAGFKKLWGVG